MNKFLARPNTVGMTRGVRPRAAKTAAIKVISTVFKKRKQRWTVFPLKMPQTVPCSWGDHMTVLWPESMCVRYGRHDNTVKVQVKLPHRPRSGDTKSVSLDIPDGDRVVRVAKVTPYIHCDNVIRITLRLQTYNRDTDRADIVRATVSIPIFSPVKSPLDELVSLTKQATQLGCSLTVGQTESDDGCGPKLAAVIQHDSDLE